MADGISARLTFGIYPGSALGGIDLGGPPDEPDRINQALDQLQGCTGRPFTVRAYDAYADPGDTVPPVPRQTPAGYDRYLGRGRTLDLVAQYHSRSGDVAGFCAFVEDLIGRHGEHLATLQVCEEPNVTGDPALDGAYPGVTEALIAGVKTAKQAAERSGRDIKVGCNSTPLPGPAAGFFTELTRAGGKQFVAGRAGHLPLVVTEHGWPTGPGRPQARQAEVLGTVIDVISRHAAALNITGYIHHTLRDARSDGSGLFCRFGLMTDDYTPKPAFGRYQDLISRFSQGQR